MDNNSFSDIFIMGVQQPIEELLDDGPMPNEPAWLWEGAE